MNPVSSAKGAASVTDSSLKALAQRQRVRRLLRLGRHRCREARSIPHPPAPPTAQGRPEGWGRSESSGEGPEQPGGRF